VICQAFIRSASTYTIEALEDSELLLLTYPCKRRLDEATTCFERYQRILLQNAFIALQGRINGALNASAEEKYTNLTVSYPDYYTCTPAYYCFLFRSYPETLSRIRNKLFFVNKFRKIILI
jgi:hypothetical protein